MHTERARMRMRRGRVCAHRDGGSHPVEKRPLVSAVDLERPSVHLALIVGVDESVPRAHLVHAARRHEEMRHARRFRRWRRALDIRIGDSTLADRVLDHRIEICGRDLRSRREQTKG
eukprot:4993297-Pleurochrysis_carterae.AAC.1